MQLSDLNKGAQAIVREVLELHPQDMISQRLRDLGFVCGEVVKVLTYGPFGKEPILVQVGHTRFALRGAEAARVSVDAEVEKEKVSQ